MSENNKCEKPFLTYEEQIKKLRDEKHLEINDDTKAIELLKRHSYFALISGYKIPFKRKDGTYQEHVSINDIYALYNFDNELRNIILEKILIVEKHIKSLLSYSFCKKYGSEQSKYLDATNYNYVAKNQEGINKLISDLSEIVKNPKDYKYIQHQKRNYDNIPLWVMVKALTMGRVSKMYSYLKPEIQTDISKEYKCVNENELARMLDMLARVRNVCAHNERLYNYVYQKGAIEDSYVHKAINIPRKNGIYKKGKSDLFAVLICLKYLLCKEDFADLIVKIRESLSILYNKSSRITPEQMRKYMGLTDNWQDITDIELK